MQTVLAARQIPPSEGSSTLTGTAILDFGNEENIALITITNVIITNAMVKGFSFTPTSTSETSLDDFSLNGVSFNMENIVDNTSFDIRGNSVNNASGLYTIKYSILI